MRRSFWRVLLRHHPGTSATADLPVAPHMPRVRVQHEELNARRVADTSLVASTRLARANTGQPLGGEEE